MDGLSFEENDALADEIPTTLSVLSFGEGHHSFQCTRVLTQTLGTRRPNKPSYCSHPPAPGKRRRCEVLGVATGLERAGTRRGPVAGMPGGASVVVRGRLRWGKRIDSLGGGGTSLTFVALSLSC